MWNFKLVPLRKFLFRVLLGAATLPLLGSGVLFFLLRDPHPVSFRSLESLTESGQPIYNRIRYQAGPRYDLWLMQQSHHGNSPDADTNWDRLAIVVDKKAQPQSAKFFQLESASISGPLDPELLLASRIPELPYKARCFACHANGPRAVRPDEETPFSIADRVRVLAWNLRIKSYGRVESQAGQSPSPSGAPFRATQNVFSQPLALESCLRCHSVSGIRNALTVEHLSTANFLVKKGLMPPFPFSISAADLERLKILETSSNAKR